MNAVFLFYLPKATTLSAIVLDGGCLAGIFHWELVIVIENSQKIKLWDFAAIVFIFPFSCVA